MKLLKGLLGRLKAIVTGLWFKMRGIDEYKVLEAQAVFKELIDSTPKQNITPDTKVEDIMFNAGQEAMLNRLKVLLKRKGFDL